MSVDLQSGGNFGCTCALTGYVSYICSRCHSKVRNNLHQAIIERYFTFLLSMTPYVGFWKNNELNPKNVHLVLSRSYLGLHLGTCMTTELPIPAVLILPNSGVFNTAWKKLPSRRLLVSKLVLRNSDEFDFLWSPFMVCLNSCES